jgi:hypothetical protein
MDYPLTLFWTRHSKNKLLKELATFGSDVVQSVQRRAMNPTARFRMSSGAREIFSTPQTPDCLCGTHLASYQLGIWFSFPGVKQVGREAEKSSPLNDKVKNIGATLPLSHTSS